MKLNDSQEALNKAENIFHQKTLEVESILKQQEKFAMETQDLELQQKMLLSKQTTTTKDTEETININNKIKEYRLIVHQLWEKMSTPIEHRMSFLETAVNKFAEADDYILQYMKQYSNKLEKTT